MVKNLSPNQMLAQSLGWKDLLEQGMAIDYNILAWRIP